MTLVDWAGIAAGLVAILATVVALTRYITKLQSQLDREKIDRKNELLEQRFSDMEIKYRELSNDLSRARESGTATLLRKTEIDDILRSIMRMMRASAGSIYMPLIAEPSEEAQGLAFLSIEPINKETATLKRKIIPIQSLAGRCFRTRKPFLNLKPKSDPEHFDRADRISGYQTEDTLNVPLHFADETIGVIQLLNKEGDSPFDENDLKKLEDQIRKNKLAAKVVDFCSAPENLEFLGIIPEGEPEVATAMFCDLTRSGLLFEQLNKTAAIQAINEYFEVICDIAISYEGTIDNYFGDSVIITFNVPKSSENHKFMAVKAALEMREAFERTKDQWIIMGGGIGGVFMRTALSSGAVQRTAVGHPQRQHLTIMGVPVSVAANLCDAATRDKNVIVIDEEIYRDLSEKLTVEKIPPERLGKARAHLTSAYEVIKLQGGP